MVKLFRSPDVIMWLCIPVGIILFVFALLGAPHTTSRGERLGSYFYLVLCFGVVPYASIWWSPFTYPIYAGLLLWGKFRLLLVVLAIQNSIWIIATLKAGLLPSELSFAWNKELTATFAEPIFYVCCLGPFMLFQAMLIYQAILGIKSKLGSRDSVA